MSTEPTDTARPGVAPGSRRTAGTMFAALYGDLVPHDWLGPEPENDAYSLFHHRSLAMGWLDDVGTVISADVPGGRAVGAEGLWAMNDAGWGRPLAPDTARSAPAAWFQVEAQAVPRDRPLPVQPFLRCAGDAVARFGTLHLAAVQLLLPVQGLAPSSRPSGAFLPSMHSVSWFGDTDPRSRTRVEVGVNSGRNPRIPAVAEQLADTLGQLNQHVLVCTSYETGSPRTAPAPPFHDTFWNGPPLHGVTLRGELAEWSLDAVGSLGEVIADLGAHLGVRSPLLLTVTRSADARA
ncbi:hypothetical protein V1L54_28530 [Streptomyces sp. TRM 70361]|uniref:hypothetical protein n=1 Tax=Streptomyces sp. TRM 70361 TaxID=3116553 RepID=UPI002E7B5113|nr:hypothetical protein [Streptomyces sp. TRM 70361]MEE1943304.1 hypothetical protein [Streptomyces sp. TRM 70361]